MDYEIIKKQKHSDQRGCLVEFLTRQELGEKPLFGHIYFVTFEKKGVVRGNHYHQKKDEYFGIAYGKLRLVIEDIKTQKRKCFILNAADPQFTLIKIGPNIAHAFESLSDKAVLVDYFSSPYDPCHPDSRRYVLIND